MRNDCLTDCLPPCIDLSYIPKFTDYEIFSFYINGLANTFLVVFGCIGNALMVRGMFNQKRQKRLRARLFMLCCWDTLLLVCVFGFSGAPCLHYNMTRLYGPTSYLLRFLQPAGSFATTASVWEIFAITAERYWAVTRPFDQLRNTRAGAMPFSTAIAIGSLLLNLPDALEMKFVSCRHFATGEIHPQLTSLPLSTERWYDLCVKLIPGLVLRSPIPFIFIAFLTIGTLYGRHNRPSLGRSAQRTGLATPVKLTVLSLKFLLCNSLFVACQFMKWAHLGSGKSLLYLGDVSNLLVTVQSATNWILFIHWPKSTTVKRSSIVNRNTFHLAERNKLRIAWSDLTQEQRHSLAINLCQIVTKHNPILQQMLKNASISETLIWRVDDFLNDLVVKLVSNRFEQACRGLRRWGIWCREQGLKVGNECWLEAKKSFVDAFADPVIAQKLAGIIISQVKHGCAKGLLRSTNSVRSLQSFRVRNSRESTFLLTENDGDDIML